MHVPTTPNARHGIPASSLGARRFLLVVLSLALLSVSPSHARGEEDAPPDPGRPRIGLALGGGGARGGAHVGVLKRLEELRIPIDYIAGTSIGSIAGGLYASGLSPADLSEVIQTTDWDEILNDSLPRRDLPYRRKQESYLALFDIEVGVSRGGLEIPNGLVAGQKLDFLLRGLTLHVSQVRDFSELGVPYQAVATNLDNGNLVVLDSGDLADAMRASMAIPGFFTPVIYQGQVLVDGGVAQNLPVQVVRAMGAEIIIAVDVGTPPKDLVNDKVSLLRVAARTVGVLTAANTKASLAELREQDILITPDLEGITTLEFSRIGEAELRGVAAVDSVQDRLRALSVSEEEYAVYLEKQRAPATHKEATIHIDRIEVVGEHRVPEQVIVRRMHLKAGEDLDLEVLHGDLHRIYELGEFEQVDFHIREEQGETVLEIEVGEKFWGPDYLRFGMRLQGNFRGAGGFLVNFLHRKSCLNRWGAEWRTLFTFGDVIRLRSDFDQPLGYAGHFFVSPLVEYTGVESGAYLSPNNRVVVEGDIAFAQLDAGYRIGNDFQFSTGVQFGVIDARFGSGETVESVKEDLGALGFRANLDDLDSVNFPRFGEYLDARFDLGLPALGSSWEYQRLYLGLVQPVTRGNTSLVFTFEGGSDLGSDLPIYEEFLLGGLFRLSGFESNQVRGDTMMRAGVIWMQRLGSLNPLFGKGIYAGISLEAGNALPSGEEWQLETFVPAASIYTGMDTVLGPFYLGWGMAEGGFNSFYFLLGHPYQLGILR